MSYSNPGAALRQYSQVGAQTGVVDADPHRLVQMLLDGALARIAAAKGHMQRNEIADKGSAIGKAISIVDALRATLDRERGGVLADSLHALYEYMERQLLKASADNQPALLDEVASLLGEVKAGWEAIPAEVRHAPR